MFNEYPYVNLQDVNLDWILKHIKDLEINLKDFIKINTIKYANPIIWNITTQYEANTVVVDGNTGTAYLSVAPVPTGVSLSNTDYWTPIFTLNLLSANQNITFRDDGTNVIASFASDTGDWLLWNFYLYRVTQPISINTAYVEGFNIERFSVELFIKDYINALAAIIGDLDDLTTSDKTSIVNAINSLLSDVNTTIGDLNDLNTSDKTSIVNAINSLLSDINTTIGDLNDLNTSDKTSIVNAINETLAANVYVTPEMYGAAGDGITDDTAAVQAALDSGKNVMMDGTYLVVAPDSSWHHALIVPSDIIIDGHGSVVLADNNYANYSIFYIGQKQNVVIKNISVIGDTDTHTDTGGEWGFLINIDDSQDIYIDNVKVLNSWGDGIFIGHLDDLTPIVTQNKNIHVTNCYLAHNSRNNITISDGQDIFISHCYMTDAYRTAPQAGIDIEPDNAAGETLYNVIIDSNVFEDNGLKGMGINHFTSTDVLKLVVSNNIFKESDAILGYCPPAANPLIKDEIFNNYFIVTNRIIDGQYNYSCIFSNNIINMPSTSNNVPLTIPGPGSQIINNTFSYVKTSTHFISLKGKYAVCANNTFKEVTCTGYLIEIDSDTHFINNTIEVLTNSIAYIIYNDTNVNRVHVTNNNVVGTSNPPNYLIGPSTTPSGALRMAFNTVATFSGGLSDNVNMVGTANIINGTFVS